MKRLYIIGNGFDIAHGTKSGYWDFKDWVSFKDYDYVFLLERLFPQNPELWGDLECNLGNYNEEDILREITQDEDDPSILKDTLDISNDLFVKNVLDKLPLLFHEWVDQIVIKNETRFNLDHAARFLTFNYIETLEKNYKIPDSHILHIHGKRKQDKVYVFGHKNKRLLEKIGRKDDLDFVVDQKKEVVKFMNGMVKDTDNIILRNDDYFKSLKDIEEVTVIGLSMNEVDHPYIEKIIDVTNPNVKWNFCYYSDKDKERILSFANKHNLSYFDLIPSEELQN